MLVRGVKVMLQHFIYSSQYTFDTVLTKAADWGGTPELCFVPEKMGSVSSG